MQAECPFSVVIYIKILLALIQSQKLINQNTENRPWARKAVAFCVWRQEAFLLRTLRGVRNFSFSTSPFPLFPFPHVVLGGCFCVLWGIGRCLASDEVVTCIQFISGSWTPLFPAQFCQVHALNLFLTLLCLFFFYPVSSRLTEVLKVYPSAWFLTLCGVYQRSVLRWSYVKNI